MPTRFKRLPRVAAAPLRGLTLALTLTLAVAGVGGGEVPAFALEEVDATPGGGGGPPPAGAGLFETDSLLTLRLEAPWRALRGKVATRPSASGTLFRILPGGESRAFEVEIQTRGKWRFENCEPPPLTLELAAEQAPGQLPEAQSIVHLTTQCKPKSRYRQFLVQEYFAYRIWEILGGAALRTRLAEVEYRDNNSGKKMWTGYALLVEDINLAAERLGRRWLEREQIRSAALDPEATALFAVFQFMIGNTDWSIVKGAPGERCCHNAALLREPDSETSLLPLPFDFDASGLVNTGQIAPSEDLPISSARQRLYRGICTHNSYIPRAVEVVVAAQPEIEALLASLDLTPGLKRTTSRYLASFYETVTDPAKLRKQILGRCRG